eukprot:8982997-Ditylum_brightwellii.AAC.1
MDKCLFLYDCAVTYANDDARRKEKDWKQLLTLMEQQWDEKQKHALKNMENQEGSTSEFHHEEDPTMPQLLNQQEQQPPMQNLQGKKDNVTTIQMRKKMNDTASNEEQKKSTKQHGLHMEQKMTIQVGTTSFRLDMMQHHYLILITIQKQLKRLNNNHWRMKMTAANR